MNAKVLGVCICMFDCLNGKGEILRSMCLLMGVLSNVMCAAAGVGHGQNVLENNGVSGVLQVCIINVSDISYSCYVKVAGNVHHFMQGDYLRLPEYLVMHNDVDIPHKTKHPSCMSCHLSQPLFKV